ncbi:MAG TPA: SAM-dependent methyltransferase, partial [Chitinophagaceae bacterium]|nr:SAM-dependent methyltransferase [Chitinophagaceae bacterium]
EDWLALFIHCGYRIQSMQEPLHPKTGKPASVIFVLK